MSCVYFTIPKRSKAKEKSLPGEKTSIELMDKLNLSKLFPKKEYVKTISHINNIRSRSQELEKNMQLEDKCTLQKSKKSLANLYKQNLEMFKVIQDSSFCVTEFAQTK